MKKIICIFIMGITVMVAFAQTQKGSKLIGTGIGGASYSDSKSTTSYSNVSTVYKSEGNSFSVSIYPNFGWFVRDNLAVGASLSLSYSNSKSTSSNTASVNTNENKSNYPSVYIGPFCRYYFGGSNKGMPFAQVNAQYGIYSGTSKNESSTGVSSETKTKPKYDWNAGASVGYEHFISQYIGIYGSVGFSYASSKTVYDYVPSPGTGYNYTSKYDRWYVPLTVGFQAHLAPKKK